MVHATAKVAQANSQGYAAAAAHAILSGIAPRANQVPSCPKENEGMSEVTNRICLRRCPSYADTILSAGARRCSHPRSPATGDVLLEQRRCRMTGTIISQHYAWIIQTLILKRQRVFE